MVREQTLKSVLTLIGKLSDRTINGELLKYLAKTANDEQPGIRTNTTICLGKIAKNLGNSSRAKVLIAAFTRSLRDPFVHARNAALMALAVTSEYFSDEDCAGRIVPSLSPLQLDKEKLVRDQANKTMDIYIQKIRKAAASLPDSALPPQNTGDGVARMSTPQPSEQASSWAGWAISSFTNKLSAAAGEIQSSSNGSSSRPGSSSSASAPAVKKLSVPTTSSASTLARQALKSPSAPLSRTSSSGNVAGDSFFPEPDPVGDDDKDAWGDMDEGTGGGVVVGGGRDPKAVAASPSMSSSTATLPSRPAPGPARTTSSSGTGTAQPFGEDEEPDFASWLAAKADKKPGGGKPLPKGLAKSGGANGKAATAAKKPLSKPAPKPVAAKKIDMAPKQTDDDDGWGDGW